MRADELIVYIVEDDPSVRDSLALMLGLAGYRTALFSDAEGFLAAWRPDWSGCLLADLRLPGQSGIELQAELRRRASTLPVAIITAHGDVPSARIAFHAEAVDFLEKPFEFAQVKATIDKSFARELRRVERAQERSADAARLQLLTAREREVLQHAAKGLHAKEIAAALHISRRTVEVHKTHIMAKLGVRNVAELVRFALAAEPREHPDTGPA